MTRLRRFIAGAVCPGCGAVDRLFVYSDDSARHCECSACGFRDSMDPAKGPEPNRRDDAAAVSPVRLIDP